MKVCEHWVYGNLKRNQWDDRLEIPEIEVPEVPIPNRQLAIVGDIIKVGLTSRSPFGRRNHQRADEIIFLFAMTDRESAEALESKIKKDLRELSNGRHVYERGGTESFWKHFEVVDYLSQYSNVKLWINSPSDLRSIELPCKSAEDYGIVIEESPDTNADSPIEIPEDEREVASDIYTRAIEKIKNNFRYGLCRHLRVNIGMSVDSIQEFLNYADGSHPSRYSNYNVYFSNPYFEISVNSADVKGYEWIEKAKRHLRDVLGKSVDEINSLFEGE